MAIRLGSNISSLQAQRRLHEGSSTLESTFERLASGQRINRASDDAAGLAIADSLRADTRVYNRAILNLSDGISYTNVYSSALDAVSATVMRLRELATQSANGTLSNNQRQSLDKEAQALNSEINRIVASTTFNGVALFSSNQQPLSLQAGYGEGSTLNFQLGKEFSRQVGNGTWQGGVSYSTSGDLNSAALADLNNDGKLDLVARSGFQTNYDVLYGNGDGTFQARRTLVSSHIPYDVGTYDLNGDGLPEILGFTTFNRNFEYSRNTGGGSFTYASLNFSTWIRGYGAGDFDGDGDGEVAIAADGGIQITRNTTGAALAKTQFLNLGLSDTAITIKVNDVDNDGNADLLVSSYGDYRVHVIRGNGDGTFKTPSTVAFNPFGGLHVIDGLDTADLNNDGNIDFVITGGFAGNTQAYLGNGDGTFQRKILSTVGTSYGVVLGDDFNSDGNADILTYGIYPGGSIVAQMGKGDGSFSGAKSIYSGSAYPVAVTGDINNDGSIDVITGVQGFSGYSVNLGNTTRVYALPQFNLQNRESALASMQVFDSALSRLAQEKSVVGAAQQRITVASNALQSAAIQSNAAESRIRDVDIAQESANLTRAQIIQQVASAVLSQANQQPNIALQLLR